MAEKLSKSQITFIDKNTRLSSEEISKKLSAPKSTIEQYIKSRNLKEKLKQQAPHLSSLDIADATTELTFGRYGFIIAIGLTLCYFLFMTYLVIQKFNAFEYKDFDLAIFNQVSWNTLHGNPFYCSIRGGNILGDHLGLISGLLLPIYWLLGANAKALLIIQNFALASAAIPLFLLAKKTLNSLYAVFFCLLYFLYPAMNNMNLFEYHTDIYSPFLYFLAFYLFSEKKFIPSVLTWSFILILKEDQGLGLIGFSILAWLDKRDKKWLLTPGLMAVIYFILAVGVAIPSLGNEFVHTTLFNHLGETNLDKVLTLLFRPGFVLGHMFQSHKLFYIDKLFSPLTYLSLFNPIPLVVLLPQLSLNLLSNYGPSSTINYQYTSVITPAVFIASIYGFKKLLQWLKNKKYAKYILIVLFIFALFRSITLGPFSHIGLILQQLKVTRHDQVKEEFINLVPKDAPVVSTFEFLSKLSTRKELESFHDTMIGHRKFSKTEYHLPEHTTHALIDFNDDLTFHGFYQAPMSPNIKKFMEDGHWGIAAIYRGLVYLKKNFESPLKFYKKYEALSEKVNILNITFNNQLLWKGYRLKNVKVGPYALLRLSCYFEAIEKPTTDYNMVVWILDKNNQQIEQIVVPLTYYIHPTSQWEKGEKIKANFWLAPENADWPQNCKIQAVLFNGWTNRGVPAILGENSPQFVNNRVPLK